MPKWSVRREEDSLEFFYPYLAKEWHPVKNQLSPKDIKPNTSKPAWWICPNGHEYEARVNDRTFRGRGCTFCSKRRVTKDNCLKTVNPKIAKEWHPTKNGNLTPKTVTAHSTKKVWWQCPDGHEWEDLVSRRTRGSKCPICHLNESPLENSLLTTHPFLVLEWNSEKNRLTPRDVSADSPKVVWWKCGNGHSWRGIIRMRAEGLECPLCNK